jgi:hypothetical protein
MHRLTVVGLSTPDCGGTQLWKADQLINGISSVGAWHCARHCVYIYVSIGRKSAVSPTLALDSLQSDYIVGVLLIWTLYTHSRAWHHPRTVITRVRRINFYLRMISSVSDFTMASSRSGPASQTPEQYAMLDWNVPSHVEEILKPYVWGSTRARRVARGAGSRLRQRKSKGRITRRDAHRLASERLMLWDAFVWRLNFENWNIADDVECYLCRQPDPARSLWLLSMRSRKTAIVIDLDKKNGTFINYTEFVRYLPMPADSCVNVAFTPISTTVQMMDDRWYFKSTNNPKTEVEFIPKENRASFIDIDSDTDSRHSHTLCSVYPESLYVMEE